VRVSVAVRVGVCVAVAVRVAVWVAVLVAVDVSVGVAVSVSVGVGVSVGVSVAVDVIVIWLLALNNQSLPLTAGTPHKDRSPTPESPHDPSRNLPNGISCHNPLAL